MNANHPSSTNSRAGVAASLTRFGAYLRSERELRNIPLAEVAARTRIRESWLELLEQGAHDRLPATVFVRGFVRAYAQAIRIDGARADRLLTDALGTGDPAEAEPFSRTPVREVEGRRLAGIALAVIVLLFAAAWILAALVRDSSGTMNGITTAPASSEAMRA